MIVVDASAVIAFLESSDAHHQRAVDLLAEAEPPIAIHTLTLAEVLTGFVEAGAEEAVLADLVGLGVEVVVLGESEPLQLARIRHHDRLRMPDACVLATALHLQCALASFDNRLVAAAQRRGVRIV